MKKALVVVCLFSCLHISTVAYSAEVTSAEAQEAVQGWATLREALGEQFTSPIGGIATYDGADGRGKFHVVSFEGGGYAVTSGDTDVVPILAYSKDGEFVAGEENPLWSLLAQDVAGRTMRLEESGNAQVRRSGDMKASNGAKSANEDSANASAWARLRKAAVAPARPLMKASLTHQTSVADLRVGPLCGTRWGQGNVRGGPCYNYYTPENYVCGCVATAMAQVMKYFEWPKAKIEAGDHWYHRWVVKDGGNVEWTVGKVPSTGEVFDVADNAAFPAGPAFGGPYDWANMPSNPESDGITDEQRMAIGQLTRDCGISVHMKYASGGGSSVGARVKLRLLDQFGYANAEVIYGGSAKEQQNAMIGSLDLGSPSIIGISGHAIVGDGYGYSEGRLYIHFNYGWENNAATAWYTPPDEDESDYPVLNRITYNICTPEKCSAVNGTVVSGRVLGDDGAPVAGETVTARDRTTGETFRATSNENGIYALLLPPETSYDIETESDGKFARATVRVERTVSNHITEKLEEDKVTHSSDGVVANHPGVDLTLSAEEPKEVKWLDESAATSKLTGVWSQDVTYGADNRAYLAGDIAFTPYHASTGSVVTVEFKTQFCGCSKDDAPESDAQAAVRLGTNGCFQVWTRRQSGDVSGGAGELGWVDAEAEGVTPVSGEEYTLRTTFDYASGTYEVEVMTGSAGFVPLQIQLGTPTRSIPLAASASRMTSVAFVGDTYFTSLSGDCRYEAIGFLPGEITVADATVVLDAAKAAWLNARGDYATVKDRLANVTSDEFATAWLCNLDIMNEDASAKLSITRIDVASDNVTVGVTLERTGAVAQKINGTLKFYGASALDAFSNGAAMPISSKDLVVDDFSGGDTAAATFQKGDAAFIEAKIEER
ncbi:MAG: C10 family peptidase [Kiritimatiellae bacterium]|nr:C10 family peptidase [Kiritimatiellia bacterium]